MIDARLPIVKVIQVNAMNRVLVFRLLQDNILWLQFARSLSFFDQELLKKSIFVSDSHESIAIYRQRLTDKFSNLEAVFAFKQDVQLAINELHESYYWSVLGALRQFRFYELKADSCIVLQEHDLFSLVVATAGQDMSNAERVVSSRSVEYRDAALRNHNIASIAILVNFYRHYLVIASFVELKGGSFQLI